MRPHTLAMLAALLLCGASPAARAQSFTFQGQLSTATGPATTAHDLEFRVYSAAEGGSQIGTATTAFAVTPVDGVFTVTVSPGNAVFTGPDRWLEISLRPAGSGAFTTLAPRQKITAAPYAARSLNERLTDIGGGVLTNSGSGVNRLLFNRTTPVTGADYFTLRTPTGEQEFGGMYLDTAAADGLPFYGFATDGTVRGFAYVDGATGAFNLSVLGNRVTVSNTGLVGVGTQPTGPERLQVDGAIKATGGATFGGSLTAASVTYAAPQARVLSIGAEAMRPADPVQRFIIDPIAGRAYFHGSVSGLGYIVAPVTLPPNATITGFEATLSNVVGSNGIQASLIRRRVDTLGSSTTIASVVTSGAVLTPTIFVDSSVTPHAVNTEAFTYAVLIACNDWDGPNTNVGGIRIRYSVPAP